MSDVAEVCGSLYASIIKKADVDFFNKTIQFNLILTEKGNETEHTLEIKDYDSLLWLEKDKLTYEDYDFKNCDYYELTAITFRNFCANSDDKWLKQYSMEYNIAIEIWESALLIKSNTVVVNGVTFKI
jgi:hypothetical protein